MAYPPNGFADPYRPGLPAREASAGWSKEGKRQEGKQFLFEGAGEGAFKKGLLAFLPVSRFR
jgi:hypothetical protein